MSKTTSRYLPWGDSGVRQVPNAPSIMQGDRYVKRDGSQHRQCRDCGETKPHAEFGTLYGHLCKVCKSKPRPKKPSPDRRPLDEVLAECDDLSAHFWNRLDTSGECWEWTGGASNGYGRVTLDKVSYPTHQVAYVLVHGPIPEGLIIDHLCRNTRCCHPDHLEAVTIAENFRRGREAVDIEPLPDWELDLEEFV